MGRQRAGRRRGPVRPVATAVLVLSLAGVLVPRLARPGTAREVAGTGPVEAGVYATREGLVGQHTANGHLITAGDHFVSLPSVGALSPRDSGTYSVRVCAPATGRCGYEPVWDVGPWNTRDDYWSATRSVFATLPVGLPEAAAAALAHFNGGRDQYGRLVTNPAGIDLADGTFRADLGLTASGWVQVAFLWTGPGTQGQIRTAGGTLNVRSGPSTTATAVGVAANRARVPVLCAVPGSVVSGPSGTSATWVRIGPGHYVAAAFVAVDPGVVPPAC